MARILTFGNYAIFVLRERGNKHHLPHAHIKYRGQRIASIFLITLEYFDQHERLPHDLTVCITDHQDVLLEAWERLNRD